MDMNQRTNAHLFKEKHTLPINQNKFEIVAKGEMIEAVIYSWSLRITLVFEKLTHFGFFSYYFNYNLIAINFTFKLRINSSYKKVNYIKVVKKKC